MAFYAAARKVSNPGTTLDVMTVSTQTVRLASIHELSVSGLGTSSAANEVSVARITTAGVGISTQITPVKINPLSPAALTNIVTAWATTQPVPDIPILLLGCNSNGGIYRWVAKPGEQISCYDTGQPNGQISIRFDTGGTDTFGIHMVFEEA